MDLPLAHARALAERLLLAMGTPQDIAVDVAQHLIESDRVGYPSHGLSMLPTYHQAVQKGFLDPAARPEILQDAGSLLTYHGHRGFGQYGGKLAVEAGVERAREHGRCILTVQTIHHLGRMGHFGELAAQAGVWLLAFTNVIDRTPVVAPFGGAEARITTNPLCFAGPLPDGRPPLLLDMATSAIALNKARVLAATGKQAPAGAIIDAAGHATTDPGVLFTDPPGALLPFGAHKGYALGLVAELLAGVLSGGGTIQPEHPRPGGLINNMFAVLIDPRAHGSEATQARETGAFIDYLLSCPPVDGGEAVQYPGEYEAANRARHGEHIELDEGLYDGLAELAKTLGVTLEG
jgi:L-lactate dehydrogenase